jgi:hypothetical protein
MTDENMARPFSGEIMAGGPRATSSRPSPATDVIDAEYVTVDPATDAVQQPAAQTQGATASPGMDILRGSEAERRRRERGGPVFWAGGLFMVAAAFWVSGGHALMARPQPAPLSHPAAMPLRIASVESRVERQGARAFLLVDGEVANDGAARATVPGLEISVAGKDGRTTRYFLGTSDRVLAPGERFAFSSRLDAPKDGVETVTVDFRKEGSL